MQYMESTAENEWEDVNRRYAEKKTAPSIQSKGYKEQSEVISYGEELEDRKTGDNEKEEDRKTITHGYGYLKKCYEQLKNRSIKTKDIDLNTVIISIDNGIIKAGEHYLKELDVELDAMFKYFSIHMLVKKTIEIELSIIEILIKLNKTTSESGWVELIEEGIKRLVVLHKFV